MYAQSGKNPIRLTSAAVCRRRGQRESLIEVAAVPSPAHVCAANVAGVADLFSTRNWPIMTDVLTHASTILAAFERAEAELVGRVVVLSDGKAGTVERIWLDELHGLRLSIRGHFGRWPVASLKLVGTGPAPDRAPISSLGPQSDLA